MYRYIKSEKMNLELEEVRVMCLRTVCARKHKHQSACKLLSLSGFREMTEGSNLVVASLMRASESFIYKDSGVFSLPWNVCRWKNTRKIQTKWGKREVMIFAGSLAGIWFIMIYWGWWPDEIREIIRTDISYTAGFKSNACEIWRLIPISVSRPILPGIAVYTRGAFVWLRYNSGRQGIQWR